jgi:hypothetical protein
VYVPSTNYFGSDSFDFQVYDGLAVSSSTTVTVTVAPAVDVPNLLVSCNQSYFPGNIVITIACEPYQGYEVQASTDLVQWQPVLSFTSSLSPAAFGMTMTNWQFFRAKTKP